MKVRNFVPLACVAMAFVLVGCSQFHEQYLFRAGRPGKANYYRVKIEGYTAFSSSQFAAGLYDAEAVDALFGELSGSGKRVSVTSGFQRTTGGTSTTGSTTATTTTSQQVTMLTSGESGKTPQSAPQTTGGASLANQKFVFFLSSNADAFVNQIQTYVAADRMQTAVTTLLFKDDLGKLEISRAKSTTAEVRAKALGAALADATASLGTGEASTGAEVRLATLQVLALLASRSNAPSPPSFESIKTAEMWLRDHPRAFRPTGGAL